MTTDNVQGGFGLAFTLNGTAIVNVEDIDEVRFNRYFRDITGHDSEDGYYDAEPDGRYRLEPFAAKLRWDPTAATHIAVIDAFNSISPSNFQVADPSSAETIQFEAHVEQMDRISLQEDVYRANVLIHPVKQPTIVLPYYKKVLNFDPTNLIAYWPLWDTSGSAAEQIAPGSVLDGTYYGPTINHSLGPDGVFNAPYFDAVNDRLNIYSSALNSVYDDNLGSIIIWAKVAEVGDWTDGVSHQILGLEIDNQNFHYIGKPSTDNQIQLYRESGPTYRRTVSGVTSVEWICYGFTFDQAGTTLFVPYMDGVGKGSFSSILAASGNLSTLYTRIGNERGDAGGGGSRYGWDGWIAHCAIWAGVAFTTPQMVDLATV